MSNSKEKFIIIDGNAVIHRAYHALPPFTTKKGVQVNAVYGFASMLLKILETYKPEYITVCFDVAKKTFRDELFEDYKAKRVKADQELYDQIPLVYDLVRAFDIPIYTKEGFEADDVIGTIATDVAKKWDGDIIIASGDKDLLQLVDKNIFVSLLQKGITDTETYDKEKVKQKFGFAPEYLVDYKALKGDPSDNIPGVPGIGDKGAVELIEKVGHIEEIYKKLNKLEDLGISKKTITLLEKNKELAFLSKKLATIVTDVKDLKFELKDCATKTINKKTVADLFGDLQFTSLTKRLFDFLGVDKKTAKNSVDTKIIQKVLPENLSEIVFKIKKQSEFFCKEILGSADILENKLTGLICGTREDVYFFEFSKLNTKQKKETFSVFEEKNILLGHNLKQLFKILLLNNVEIKNEIFDLMIASYLTNSSSKAHDLKSIVARELGREIKENNQTSLFGDGTETLPQGLETLFELFDFYHKELKDQQNDDLFHKLEMPLIKVLAQMELNGIKIDTKKIKNLAKEVDQRIIEVSEKIWELAGKKFNIASSVQLRDILFVDMELPTYGIKKGKTGYSTAASELAKLKDTHEIIPLIEEHRELSKLKNTYVDVLPNLVNKNTGRIHTDFNQAVTTTGRLSSSDPNLQNIPTRTELGKKIRDGFVAEKDCVLISADYSQIELRIAASLAKDEKMLEVFRKDEDIHTATAAIMNDVPENAVTKEMRRAAKAINFGVLYGMGPYGLAEGAGISEAEARDFIAKYFEKFSGVKKYVESTKQFAKEHGYVETFFGRRRYIPELRATNFQVRSAGERMAINMPIQGSSADMMKLAMIKISQKLESEFKKDEAKIVLQVHDELIFEVKKNLAPKVSEMAKHIMESTQHFNESVKLLAPIKVNTEIGENWGELK